MTCADVGPVAARLSTFTAEEGGRHTPFRSNYRPQFHFRTTDVPGALRLGAATMIFPGDTSDLTVELGRPIAMDVGLGFAVREGGRKGTRQPGSVADQ